MRIELVLKNANRIPISALRVDEWSNAWVDVETVELVEPENVNVVKLHRHVATDFLSVADVPLLCVRSFKIRIEHATAGARQRIVERTRNRRRR